MQYCCTYIRWCRDVKYIIILEIFVVLNIKFGQYGNKGNEIYK